MIDIPQLKKLKIYIKIIYRSRINPWAKFGQCEYYVNITNEFYNRKFLWWPMKIIENLIWNLRETYWNVEVAMYIFYMRNFKSCLDSMKLKYTKNWKTKWHRKISVYISYCTYYDLSYCISISVFFLVRIFLSLAIWLCNLSINLSTYQ